jgi:hypothetical protein
LLLGKKKVCLWSHEYVNVDTGVFFFFFPANNIFVCISLHYIYVKIVFVCLQMKKENKQLIIQDLDEASINLEQHPGSRDVAGSLLVLILKHSWKSGLLVES